MKKTYFLFLLFFNMMLAQNNKIDSLLQVINTTKNDSIKVDVYNKLSWKYIFTDKEKALEILKITEKYALKTNQKYGYNTFLNNKGIFFDVNGFSDSAKIYFEKSVAYSIKNKFLIQEQYSYNNLGMFNWNKGRFQEALNWFFKALKLAEKNQIKDNTIKIDATLNNIGLIYQEMELFEKAIPYHQKALEIRSERKYAQGEASSYNNLGICYKELNKINEAKTSFKNGIQKANKAEDKTVYYNNLQGLAQIYALENKPQKALELYLESYNRPAEVPINSSSLVKMTSEIAELYLQLNQTQKAIEFGEKSVYEINKETDADVYEVNVYKTLAKAYFKTGNSVKGSFYNELYYKKIALKFKESSAKALQELETKYESEKRELELAQAKNENLVKENKIKRKNYLIYGAFGLAFLLGLIGFLVYKQQKLKNEQLLKENELRQALTKIETQNRLQEQRIEISRELHDNIGSQLTFIISSIDNLKFFDLSKEDFNKKYDSITGFTRNTITELRDSIWAMNKEEITFEDLKARTANFIENAKISLQGIQFEFVYPKEHEKIKLDSKTGITLYRIIQESVNNAIKHAKATQISVTIVVKSDNIKINITDNGKGFDYKTIEKGNGINSLEKRAKEIKASIQFISQNGMQVVVEVPKI
ncbi:tetratricopeptide repeat protein [uncultured Flavobacterium sp.]|uniref:tetratricopeptide repeat-containing sensor histidine kinase n=1 Tax=uncultured Flavobacterium sp. TaxID=165435 RepID=UPI0030C82EDA